MGLVSVAVSTAVLAVLHTLVPKLPFPPIRIAQGLVRRAPGGFATFFIERLGHLSLPSAAILTSVAYIAFGAAWGWSSQKVSASPTVRSAIAAAAPAPIWALGLLMIPTFEGDVGRGVFAFATLFAALVGALASLRIASRSISSARGPRSTEAGAGVVGSGDGLRDRRRRALVLWAAAGGVALAVGAADLGRRFGLSEPEGRRLVFAVLRHEATRPGEPEFDAIPGLTPRVTPTGRFYVVDEALADPMLDPSAWRLRVFGLVRQPLAITYDELLRFPAVERFQTLECISNPVGGNLISTARWEGISLAEILDRAGVEGGAIEVVFRSADGYSDSLAIDVAMTDGPLIAVGMDGEPLPVEHGFPARVLGPGTYGMKNPKWLTSIEVVDAPYTGFWEERGWSREATVKTTTRFDTPAAGSTIAGSATIAGVAFAGDRGISRVEISSDGGRTWSEADLEPALSPFTWVRWRLPWSPSTSGVRTLRARAVDGDGAPQSPTFAPPHPYGASGYPLIAVSVRA